MSAVKRSSLSVCVLIYKMEGIMIVIRTLESDKLGFNSGFITVFFFFFKYVYLCIFGSAGSSLLCRLFSVFREWGLLSTCSTRLFIAEASLADHEL